MLLLDITRKAYMGSPMTLKHLTLKVQIHCHSDFETYIHKGEELGHMLLLSINRKAYMECPMTLSHLTLSDLERSKSRSLIF